MDAFPGLPSIPDALFPLGYDERLPQVPLAFYMPKLADAPQNPIMDTLRLAQELKALQLRSAASKLPGLAMEDKPVMLVDGLWDESASLEEEVEVRDVWQLAARAGPSVQNRIKSWDMLRPSMSSQASSTPFISEQSPDIFTSIRHHVLPHMRHPNTTRIHVSATELASALRQTLVGMSSTLHVWDPSSETFLLKGTTAETQSRLVIEGKDEVVSESLLSRFLNIGTHLRRLDVLAEQLSKSASTSRKPAQTPTTYAFAHALSSILRHLRDSLSSSWSSAFLASDGSLLTTIWLRHAEYEDMLVALAGLCQRDISHSPSTYSPLPATPAALLSHIYMALEDRLEHHAPGAVVALFAYILTVASRPYLQELGQSVGYGSGFRGAARSAQAKMHADGGLGGEDLDESVEAPTFIDDNHGAQALPAFVLDELVEALPRAQGALRLLYAAVPDHPLCRSQHGAPDIRWFWTEREVEQAWMAQEGDTVEAEAEEDPPETDIESTSGAPGRTYKPGIEQFAIFDLDPGAHTSLRPHGTRHNSDVAEFLRTFPDTLPTLTPTMVHLTGLVLSPLVAHVAQLSGALLAVFLPNPKTRLSVAKPAVHLNLRGHLVLLRGFLLLTSHDFKARLQAALFSDADAPADGPPGAARYRVKRLHHGGGTLAAAGIRLEGNAQAVWAVGLGPGLTERETWPPGGADLSFLLRTVIVDSLESLSDEVKDDGEMGRVNVLAEAEYRLGFAIRDLPMGAGRDKWLNPTSIEALDFLYMDYKPPHPVDAVITPEILSRYQRIFAFLLRVMRVENVISALFRMARASTTPLFETLAGAQKMFLHFRTMAHAFVSSLSSYAFTTAIGANFDCFLARLAHGTARDVFAVAADHAHTLDDILTACLLRSGQRAVGELVMDSLETVLDLGILAGEVRARHMEEYRAAPVLEDLFAKFRRRMMTLVKVLQGIVGKGSSSTSHLAEFVRDTDGHRAPGGVDALSDLLTRLDLNGWWKQQADAARSTRRSAKPHLEDHGVTPSSV